MAGSSAVAPKDFKVGASEICLMAQHKQMHDHQGSGPKLCSIEVLATNKGRSFDRSERR